MKKALDLALFDERVAERNIASGKITQKDLDDHLKTLSDDSGNVDYTVIEEDEEDEDELADEFDDEEEEEDE